jgi:hypothetical protein
MIAPTTCKWIKYTDCLSTENHIPAESHVPCCAGRREQESQEKGLQGGTSDKRGGTIARGA